MIVFLKLLLAHLIGDFILQPGKWVAQKEAKKHRSGYLYLHILLHGTLAAVLVMDTGFIGFAAVLAAGHGAIDFLKLAFQTQKTKRTWFVADQLLHLLLIGAVALLYAEVDCSKYEIDPRFWVYATAVLLLTTPASITIKNIISIWTPDENGTKEADLQNAGKYIGILERLFVFFFIVTGNFASIGFLMAAKSIFRFGDLTKSHDRKLTEYVMIGTLLSFATAIGAAFLAKFALTLLPV
jgi:hypothetical protein